MKLQERNVSKRAGIAKEALLIISGVTIIFGAMSYKHEYDRANKFEYSYSQEVQLNKELSVELNLTKEELAEKQKQLRTINEIMSQPLSREWKVNKATATAYSPFDNQSGIEAEGDGKTTSIGLTPGPNIIAVDPSRIPYGSELVLVYPDGTVLRGTAGDTGGALRQAEGLLLDVFKQTYAEACEHGRKDIILFWKSK